jgi:hypothetical protein
MSTSDIEAARSAFARFENNIAKGDAAHDLKEALDYALDVIEGAESTGQAIHVAQNLVHTYRGMLVIRISTELADTGSFDVDYYSHWMDLARIFQDVDFDDDKKLSQFQVGLMKKATESLSKTDRIRLLKSMKRDLEKD